MKSFIVFGWMAMAFVGFQLFLFAISDALYSTNRNGPLDGALIGFGIILILKGLGKAFDITNAK